MEYYIEKLGNSEGPYTIEELRNKITSDTLVWTQGFSDWQKASETKELDFLFNTIPPPLPKKEKILKVETTINKHNAKLIDEKNEIRIATEIKKILIISTISFLIGLFCYMYESSENLKYSQLISNLQTYTSQGNEIRNRCYNNKIPLSEDGWKKKFTQKEIDNLSVNVRAVVEGQYYMNYHNNVTANCKEYNDWLKLNEGNLEAYISLSKEYGCYRHFGGGDTGAFDESNTISELKSLIDYNSEKAFSLSKKVFFISILVLIIGRYILLSLTWVSKKAA